MSDDLEKTLYTAHRSIQEKHIYFLLAAAGAAIGFAITRTSSSPLHWSHIPLALAVLCWGLSFYFGCRHVDYSAMTVFTNLGMVRLQRGNDPLAGNDPRVIAFGEGEFRRIAGEHSENGARAFRWAFRLLILGAILFVVWHITEMYLLAFPKVAPLNV